MTPASESYRIAFRITDKRFVVRDNNDNDVFAGNYRDVESWLDQRENTVSALRESEAFIESETDATEAVLKATMLTQEMVEKALAPEPESRPASLRSRLFGRKQKVK
jgi:hypothetical protein